MQSDVMPVAARTTGFNPIPWVLLLSLVALIWLFRFDVTPVSNGDRTGGAYVLDRWTGHLQFVYGAQQFPVEPAKAQ